MFEPETGMLFVSTREGMIHIYHEGSPNKLSEVETVKAEYGTKTMGVDPKTHNLIVSTFDPPAATESEARKFSRAGLWALNSIGRPDCGQAAVSLIRSRFVPLDESSVSRYVILRPANLL